MITDEQLMQSKYWFGENRVVVIMNQIKIKSPVTNTWFDGVIYAEYQAYAGGELRARTLVDFFNNYKPHEILGNLQ